MSQLLDIRREAKHDAAFKSLVFSKENPDGLFPTLREAMLFLASLGFETQTREKLTGSTRPLEGEIFSGPETSLFIRSLAAAATNSEAPLGTAENSTGEGKKAREELRSIFEEYINGGLKYLADWQTKTSHPDDMTASLLELLSTKFLLEDETPSAHGESRR
jgi:dnd system-associated protein 4